MFGIWEEALNSNK